jgi:hypothetical protein
LGGVSPPRDEDMPLAALGHHFVCGNWPYDVGICHIVVENASCNSDEIKSNKVAQTSIFIPYVQSAKQTFENSKTICTFSQLQSKSVLNKVARNLPPSPGACLNKGEE